MRLFYLVATIIVALILLILSVAQFGASCSLNLLSASPVVILLVISLLGAAMGAFFILFLVAPNTSGDSPEDVG